MNGINDIQRWAEQDRPANIARSIEQVDALMRGKFKELLMTVWDQEPEQLRVLDIGCGTGKTIQEVVKSMGRKVEDVTGTGVDLDPIGEPEDERVKFIKADATNLPFEDSSFDIGYSVATLQYIEDPLAAIMEADRVIRPGGVFLWQQPSPAIPFLSPSFQQIRDDSPEMREHFSLQPKVIVNHPRSEAPITSPFIQRFSFPAYVGGRIGRKGKAKWLFQCSSYGLKPSLMRFLMEEYSWTPQLFKRLNFASMGIMDAVKTRGIDDISDARWADCTDTTEIQIADYLDLNREF